MGGPGVAPTPGPRPGLAWLLRVIRGVGRLACGSRIDRPPRGSRAGADRGDRAPTSGPGFHRRERPGERVVSAPHRSENGAPEVQPPQPTSAVAAPLARLFRRRSERYLPDLGVHGFAGAAGLVRRPHAARWFPLTLWSPSTGRYAWPRLLLRGRRRLAQRQVVRPGHAPVVRL